jgi:hypothetical protein
MPRKSIMAVAAAIMTVSIAVPVGAEASSWDRRARYVDDRGDPYGYLYQPRGYYPYYNSGYWVPVQEMRYRYRYHFALPKYYPAWGEPRPDWRRAEIPGRIYPWHW